MQSRLAGWRLTGWHGVIRYCVREQTLMLLMRAYDVLGRALMPIAAAATRAVHYFVPLMLPTGAPSKGALANRTDFSGQVRLFAVRHQRGSVIGQSAPSSTCSGCGGLNPPHFWVKTALGSCCAVCLSRLKCRPPRGSLPTPARYCQLP